MSKKNYHKSNETYHVSISCQKTYHFSTISKHIKRRVGPFLLALLLVVFFWGGGGTRCDFRPIIIVLNRTLIIIAITVMLCYISKGWVRSGSYSFFFWFLCRTSFSMPCSPSSAATCRSRCGARLRVVYTNDNIQYRCAVH